MYMQLAQTCTISIHALLAESDGCPIPGASQPKISIHALLAESDPKARYFDELVSRFLSTLSLRRATTVVVNAVKNFYPRSPCGERLPKVSSIARVVMYFYPRSPCGERLLPKRRIFSYAANFYPRSPCGERPDLPVCIPGHR